MSLLKGKEEYLQLQVLSPAFLLAGCFIINGRDRLRERERHHVSYSEGEARAQEESITQREALQTWG